MDTKAAAACPLQQFLASEEAMQLRQETLLSIMVSGSRCIALGRRTERQGRVRVGACFPPPPQFGLQSDEHVPSGCCAQASWAGGARSVQRHGGKAEAFAKWEGGDPIMRSTASSPGTYTASA